MKLRGTSAGFVPEFQLRELVQERKVKSGARVVVPET